jgi:myo-inositol-1(or 4)-monophosphatase
VSWASELAVARRAAAAGAVLVRDFPRDAMGVRGKRAYDPVTLADHQSQAAVLGILAQETPDIAVLAEEDHDTTTAGRPRWIVDPLDGTTNFVHGVPQVAVSVALEVDGRVVVGVTHDVYRGEVWWASRGAGAFVDGRPLRVSEVARPEQALVGLGFPSGARRAEVSLGWLASALREVGCVRRCGAATLDLAWVAGGRLDAFVELGLAPWDTAAGVVLIEEAGGLVTGLRGEPFQPGDRWVLASNGPLHAAMRRWLAEEAGA